MTSCCVSGRLVCPCFHKCCELREAAAAVRLAASLTCPNVLLQKQIADRDAYGFVMVGMRERQACYISGPLVLA